MLKDHDYGKGEMPGRCVQKLNYSAVMEAICAALFSKQDSALQCTGCQKDVIGQEVGNGSGGDVACFTVMSPCSCSRSHA